MAFSMHSHSGQFCPGHAKDQLEDVILTAISQGMQSFGCTEHMPPVSVQDLYPDEVKSQETIEVRRARHEAFLLEAVRLREKYSGKIKILIGFEGEWIRPSLANFLQELASNPIVDYFIGSVHHVHEIPIDYDATLYYKARDVAGGSDERIFEDYFDAQFDMLTVLRPKVVGHFDLIRLLSDEPNRNLRTLKGVWTRIVRNLKLVVVQGGLLEINSSALRKGLKEPYPTRSVCEEFLKLGGKLTLSDDSHGIAQVGTNFKRAVNYIEDLGVQELHLLELDGQGGCSDHTGGAKILNLRSVPLSTVKQSLAD